MCLQNIYFLCSKSPTASSGMLRKYNAIAIYLDNFKAQCMALQDVGVCLSAFKLIMLHYSKCLPATPCHNWSLKLFLNIYFWEAKVVLLLMTIKTFLCLAHESQGADSTAGTPTLRRCPVNAV